MKKNKAILFALPIILAGCTKQPIESFSSLESSVESSVHEKTHQEQYKLRTENSILSDPSFKNGFRLISTNPLKQVTDKIIDYNGEAEIDFWNEDSETSYYWSMCQWWTPYNFKDAIYKKEGNTHTYQNESRYLAVNPTEGSITMELNSGIEYDVLYDGKKPVDKSWSHFLIQQVLPWPNYTQVSKVAENDGELHVTFDITVDKCDYVGKKPISADYECAQLMFYLQLYNRVPEGASYEEAGKPNAKIWFGMPIMDSRYTTVANYIGGDTGFEGATGHLIYSLASNTYLPQTGIEYGHKYHIDLDVMEYLKTAFVYAATNGYLTNAKWDNLYLHYMNFGWELPGEYDVSSTLSNLDIYTVTY